MEEPAGLTACDAPPSGLITLSGPGGPWTMGTVMNCSCSNRDCSIISALFGLVVGAAGALAHVVLGNHVECPLPQL